MGRGCPLPSRLGGLGQRRRLPLASAAKVIRPISELRCHFLLSLTECKPLSKRLRQHHNDIFGFSTVPAGYFM